MFFLSPYPYIWFSAKSLYVVVPRSRWWTSYPEFKLIFSQNLVSQLILCYHHSPSCTYLNSQDLKLWILFYICLISMQLQCFHSTMLLAFKFSLIFNYLIRASFPLLTELSVFHSPVNLSLVSIPLSLMMSWLLPQNWYLAVLPFPKFVMVPIFNN